MADNAANRFQARRFPTMPKMTVLLSRRRFAQLISAGAAYAVASRRISLADPLLSGQPAEPALHFPATAGVVRLSSNENPYGPSPMALKAMTESFSLAWRYPDEHANL